MYRQIALFLTLFFSGLCVCAQAESSISKLDFQKMSNEINQDPWSNYQLLLKHSPNESLSDHQTLWYLLRKAQAENLLYFFDDFEETTNQALLLTTDKTPKEISSLLHVYAGLNYQRNAEYSKAISSLELAMQQSDKGQLSEIYYFAKLELAYTRSLMDSYQASLLEIGEAFEQAKALNNLFLQAMINETYGAVYGYMGKYKQSITYYQKALDGYKDIGYRPYEAEAIYGMASTYRYWGKYDLAITYFELYIDKVTYTPNKDATFHGNYGLGMTLAERGSCIKAIPVIDKALTLNGLADYNAELYKRKASCYLQLKQYQASRKSLELAKHIFSQIPEINGTSWQLETIKIESELENAIGNYSQAYQLMTEYHEKHTQRITDNSSERITNLRNAYEIEHRDSKISLLQQQAKVQTLQAEKQLQDSVYQRYLLIFAVVLIVVILIAFILQRRYTNKVIAISIRDSLSGLFNRRYIFQLFEDQAKSLSHKNGSLSVIILDIDDFKQINDQYGHPFGDQVIRIISKICQQTLRTEDAIGRIGGEEFLCILPRIDHQKCLRICQRMSNNVAKHVFLDERGNSFFVTISIGISNASSEIISTESLFLQADRALYHSKESGKNKVTFYDDIS